MQNTKLEKINVNLRMCAHVCVYEFEYVNLYRCSMFLFVSLNVCMYKYVCVCLKYLLNINISIYFHCTYFHNSIV